MALLFDQVETREISLEEFVNWMPSVAKRAQSELETLSVTHPIMSNINDRGDEFESRWMDNTPFPSDTVSRTNIRAF